MYISLSCALFLIASAPDEEEKARRIMKYTSAKNIYFMCNLGLDEYAATMKKAVLLISNVSGNIHLASAVKTPQVVIFGPDNKNWWFPWHCEHIIVSNDSPCSPCHYHDECPKKQPPYCIQDITVEMVFAAVERMLEKLL